MNRIWKAIAFVGVAVGIAVWTSRTPLLAHHSFAVYYLESDTIEIEGDVVEFQYKNPHAWIFVQGTERPGDPQKIYAAEWVSVSQLDRAGISKNFFKPGDSLRIWASPNKNPTDNRVRLKRMERRSDGWRWVGGRGETR
ncbi:MAG TPA: DUF6152 family protein [Vicinamibacterales bacterium]|nr:DUF6152 family protein [Vicinamibacterales bacterium]